MKVYFKNLNTIRFFAALLVIIHHVEQNKELFNIPNHFTNPMVLIAGKLGVYLFFVLSGFLISYLLFKEQEVTSTINIKYFYIRRILRIWPLYFLIFFLAIFVLPNIPFFVINGYSKDVIWSQLWLKIIMLVFFLPNYMFSIFGIIPYAAPAWSIGVEEQFYLIWPFLVKKIKKKIYLFIGVIIGYHFIKLFFTYFIKNESLFIVRDVWSTTPITCMAIGGFFALLIYDNSNIYCRLKEFLFQKKVQWITLMILIGLFFKGYYFDYFHNEIYSILFGVLICNFAANEERIFSLENRLFNFLGKISYGLYMFHSVVSVIIIKLLQNKNEINNYYLYPLVIMMTILVSILSYEFFEKRFINKKMKFSKIISGDNTMNEINLINKK